MKKLNINGVGAIESLLVIVIVGAIAGLGYYVYRQNQSQQVQPTTTSEVSSSKEKEPESTLPNVTTTLVIKEWGVQLEVKGASDPVYKIYDGVAWISTDAYESSPECKKTSEELSIDDGSYPPYFQGIAKLGATDKPYAAYTADKETMAELYQKGDENVVKIGDSYYNYTHGNGLPCSDNERPDFLAAFKTLRKS